MNVAAGQQIKIWVTDEDDPFISPGETVDSVTGLATPASSTSRYTKLPDGYFYEPALYLSSTGYAGDGGTPYFPNYVRGDYNNTIKTGVTKKGLPLIEPVPDGGIIVHDAQKNPPPPLFTAEFIWDVNSLGLQSGQNYAVEFVVHDGDTDFNYVCVNVHVQ